MVKRIRLPGDIDEIKEGMLLRIVPDEPVYGLPFYFYVKEKKDIENLISILELMYEEPEFAMQVKKSRGGRII